MNRFNFIFFLLASVTFAQGSKTDSVIKKQIEEYNTSFSNALVKGSQGDLVKAYTDETIFMPEHSRERVGSKTIRDFYKQWLAQAKIASYERKILDLQDFGNYILEIGTFDENLNLNEQNAFLYTGKYAVLWKKSSNRSLPPTIAAEIWGSSSYFDDKNIPNIDDSSVPKTEEYSFSDKLASEIKERNNTIRDFVKNRQGAEHAKMFMPDAMYLTYYTPILSGEKEITDYFTEHEKPGTLNIDKISILTSGIIYARTAIIEVGYYSVDWRDGDNHGNVKGKSMNVWKKDNNGALLLFRQIVNHD
ncbi:nuclear transport factor 2 family protein [Flavobacterium sp. LHD-85]|uniref:nuclear transport factor 2 family protein n=1 Tax=Flavobacterium sp. LHD-85 TaxID=3071410 RepID=UPI0027DF7364|nr:nuclear transport factor 2 family protein [Flavobacterium sp. LHD-85]MDQ6531423.1 nuclear transport factor 2 family protein [Flavobacterium sp. LHD-85]